MPPGSQDLLCQLPKAVPYPYTHRPKIWHSPSLLRIPTCCRTSLGTAPRNLKPISSPQTTFEDAVVLISAARVPGIFLRHATEMCQRRCHPCTPTPRATRSSMFNAPARSISNLSEGAVCVAQPFLNQHGVPVSISMRAHVRSPHGQRHVLTDAHAYADHAPLATPAHTSHHRSPQHPH
ncbi:hypothetical protein MTO96_035290 [Rhipicephalus appendiculatus]